MTEAGLAKIQLKKFQALVERVPLGLRVQFGLPTSGAQCSVALANANLTVRRVEEMAQEVAAAFKTASEQKVIGEELTIPDTDPEDVCGRRGD